MPDSEDLAEAMRLELMLLEPAVRADPDRLRSLLHAEFSEMGAFGRRWDRSSIIAALGEETGNDAAEVEELAARAIAPAAILVTYISARSIGRTFRSSIWVWSGGGWSVLFHQGTVIPADLATADPTADPTAEPSAEVPGGPAGGTP